MIGRLLPISAATYESHLLHRGDRPWTETNCWTDAVVELLHGLGLEPLAVAACTVATDFEGDQWQMYKFPPEDLRSVFGIEVHEMNPYRDLDTHVVDLLALGRLTSIEVDAWWLPDTRGISYRVEHRKTSIIPNAIDTEARTIGYFHNAGYHEASGEDYDGLLRVGSHAEDNELLPYVELIRLEDLRRPDDAELGRLARDLLLVHRARRPADNPIDRMAERLTADLPWIVAGGEPAFHTYAFISVRQCGAAADTASVFCRWLADLEADLAPALTRSAEAWSQVSDGAKSLELKLARAARGRPTDLSGILGSMSQHWSEAQQHLDELSA